MTQPATETSKTASSKSAAKAPPPNKGVAAKVEFKAPEGFTDQSQDVKGFYDVEIEPVIQFVPNEAVLMDSDMDETKPSILIFGTLALDCKVKEGGKNGNIITAKKGDPIGIWAKPGMRALRNLAGVHVIMYPDGVKETGKPNPMTTFKILAKAKGGKLPIVEDRRDKSRSAETWLDQKVVGPAPF